MPYARPTLTQINASALQDVQSASLPGVDGLLQRAVLRILAWAMSGLAYEHYGYQDYTAQQSVPYTATGENLTGWAALKGVTQKAPTGSSYQVSFPGVAGTPLPNGTAINTLNSLSFSTTGLVSVGANNLVSAVINSSGTGTIYNLSVGTTISLAGSIAGITSTGVVTAVITSGTDLETEDAFRTRMLQTYAAPPQGGSATDYVEWAEAVPGITRAWCNPNGFGAGSVVVYIMLDSAESAFGGFPQGSNGTATAEPRAPSATGDQLTAANAILPLQPVTALVTVVAPIAQPINFAVASLLPFTAGIEAGINVALADLFLRIGSPLGMTIYPSDWETAIGSVAGITHFNVIAPSAPVVLGVGKLPTLGTMTPTA